MPLTAIIQSTQARIVIADDLDLAKVHRDELVCPICDAPLIAVREHFRGGHSVSAYARHRDPNGHAETAYRYHPESIYHLSAKKHLAENAAHYIPLVAPVASFAYEVRLDAIKRIADVQLTLVNGDVIIVEAQLATIAPEEIVERTNDYQSLGYAVCWFLGENVSKDYNVRACQDSTGFCGLLSFREEAIDYRDQGVTRQAA